MIQRETITEEAQQSSPSLGAVDAKGEVGALREALAAAEARERWLSHELQHRVRNMLAVIRSIHRRTWESGASQDEFAEHFQGRIDAIARYQAQLGAPGVELEDMLREELLRVHCNEGPHCTIAGPAVRLQQKAAELMGLAVHELVTNSIKFGALAQDGKLAIEWALAGDPTGSRLNLRWVETGIAPLAPAPRPSGFGRQLIEEVLPYQLGAVTSFEIMAGRLECCIALPLPGASGESGSVGSGHSWS